MEKPVPDAEITILPATAEHWPDLEALFGKSGASGGCWCMFWRLPRKDYKQMKSEEKHQVLKNMTESNQVPGLLAYQGGKAVGWISIGPRQDFAALETSRLLKRVDEQPVWSIVCFFIARGARRQGLMAALLHGALEYARSQGATIVEAYPIDMEHPKLKGQTLTTYAGYMGIASAFREVGFQEVAQPSETQRIMRYAFE